MVLCWKLIEKFGHKFSLNLFDNESLYCLLSSCINPIFGKNRVPETWTKMFAGNQITGLLNQLYFQKESTKWPISFAYWYKFVKIKSWWKSFWVGMVKNGYGYYVHFIYELSWEIYELRNIQRKLQKIPNFVSTLNESIHPALFV